MTGERRDAEERAKAWCHDRRRRVCDVIEPWAHGTIVRATRFPDYWDYNVLRVEHDPRMDVSGLVAAADEALAGCAHRRIDFDDGAVGDSYRDAFKELGWRTFRLLYMRHEADPGERSDVAVAVEQVPYDAVGELRAAWYREDFPDQEPSGYPEQAREVANAHGARVFAARRDGETVGFAQLEREGGAAEITQVYVHPDHRGDGLGTAITRASVDAAGPVADLWISADDEDRPKELYGRLGFSPVWLSVEMTRLP